MTDVVVIGAGISGAAAAYELARAGARVVLLDRYGPAAMASGWTLAGVRQSGGIRRSCRWPRRRSQFGKARRRAGCRDVVPPARQSAAGAHAGRGAGDRAGWSRNNRRPGSTSCCARHPRHPGDRAGGLAGRAGGLVLPQRRPRRSESDRARLRAAPPNGRRDDCGSASARWRSKPRGGRVSGRAHRQGRDPGRSRRAGRGHLRQRAACSRSGCACRWTCGWCRWCSPTPMPPMLEQVIGVANADCRGRQEASGRFRVTSGAASPGTAG